MFCSNCGTTVSSGDKWCPKCGKRIVREQAVAAPAGRVRRRRFLIVAIGVAILGALAFGIYQYGWKAADVAGISVAPPMPISEPGFKQSGAPQQVEVRAWRAGSVVPNYPVNMSGCGSALSTVRWRAVAGTVRVMTGRIAEPDASLPAPDSWQLVAEHQRSGVMTLGNCSQPIFFNDTDGYSTLVVEYVLWLPSL